MSTRGWFAYMPENKKPPPTPEQRAVAAAQRSVASSGVPRISEDISDDDLYEAFIEFLGCFGLARETDTGVIRLDIAEDMYPTGREAGLPLTVYLSRSELRRLAWADEDIFDDTDLLV